MRIVTPFAATTALIGLLSAAAAQPIPTLDRVAESGKPQKVLFLPNLNPDCTSAGALNFSTLGGPGHGQITVETRKEYPTFPPAHPRFKCNARKIPGPVFVYTSSPNYVGEDEVVIEIVNENGIPLRARIHLTVR